jgi:hypothetical protein
MSSSIQKLDTGKKRLAIAFIDAVFTRFAVFEALPLELVQQDSLQVEHTTLPHKRTETQTGIIV